MSNRTKTLIGTVITGLLPLITLLAAQGHNDGGSLAAHLVSLVVAAGAVFGIHVTTTDDDAGR